MINWSWQIYLYLWLAGMAGGAYFASFLVDRFAGGTQKGLRLLSIYIGVPSAVVGVSLLLIELGQPMRFWHLLLNFDPGSPMSMGTWILLLWVGIGVVTAVLSQARRWLSDERLLQSLGKLLNVLSWTELCLSALLMSYTGVLLSSSSQPLWSATLLLPALFVVSATSTGVAAVVLGSLLTRTKSVPREALARLSEADAVLIILEMVVLMIFGFSLGRSGAVGAGDALRVVATGPLAVPFWAGVVALALVVPLALELSYWGKKVAERTAWRVAAASTACVILGGLVLRAVIVIGGQLQ